MLRTTDISEVIRRLKDSETGVIPTDTVYGLVASAHNEAAVAKIYELKARQNEPGTIIAASADQIANLGVDRRFLDKVKQYWPGAISVIVPYAGHLDYLHLGKESLAVRIPDNDFLLRLLELTGPLVTSSANLTGEPIANTAGEAYQYFGDKADFYVDGGDLSGAKPSTIIRISDEGLEILRRGAVEIK